jgi:hypothetical protein
MLSARLASRLGAHARDSGGFTRPSTTPRDPMSPGAAAPASPRTAPHPIPRFPEGGAAALFINPLENFRPWKRVRAARLLSRGLILGRPAGAPTPPGVAFSRNGRNAAGREASLSAGQFRYTGSTPQRELAVRRVGSGSRSRGWRWQGCCRGKPNLWGPLSLRIRGLALT